MESISILQFLNIFMNFAHILLILFIIFAWLSPRLQIVHLIVVLLTGLSWIIFIQTKSIGYCIITDWHWQILRKMGESKLPETYVQYLYEQLTGLSMQKYTSRIITSSGWIFSLILSLVLVIRKYFFSFRLKVIK